MTAVELEVPDGLDLFEVPRGEEERKAFRVRGLGEATWAMEHAADRARQEQEIAQLAAERIERIQAWAAGRIEALRADRAFFEGALKLYALEVRAADPRRKSVSTPFGRVATRESGRTWEVADEAALIEALRSTRPDLIRTTEKLLLGEAKKVLVLDEDDQVVDEKHGQVIPGVRIVESSVTARVELDGPA